MTLADIAVRLASLHETPAWAAARFDAGAAFTGRVAVLPSAFNPPTRAHLALLELGRETEGIESVAAVLSTRNVDKHLFGAPLAHRVCMLLELSARRSWLSVLATNAARLVDQGEALQNAFPGVAFDFIVGYDTLVRIFDPRYYEDMDATLAIFFGRHRVIATNRAEATLEAVREYVEGPEPRRWRDRIVVREISEEHAWHSSTNARTTLRHDQPAPALEPEVEAYVRRHLLYGEMEA